jgi:DNA primase
MDIKDLVKETGYIPKRKAACHGGEYCSPCPFCKDGDDRFIIQPNRHNKNGTYTGGRYSCRVCSRYGDAIKFLRELYGLNYVDACNRLKLEPKIIKTNTETKSPYKPPIAEDPTSLWIKKAKVFIDWCHSKLINSPKALVKIQDRGFTLKSINQYKIGFNPGDDYGRDFIRDRQDWGLPEIIKDDKNPKKLWLPVGFTIPTFSSDGHVLKIKVRRIDWKDNDKLPKYVEISGSKPCPSVYGDTKLQIGLVLESEFDGLLIQQEAGNVLYCVALGGSTKPIDADTYTLLKRTQNVLFLPDFDKAGAVAWLRWKKMFPKINRILTPHEKSAGDYFITGGNIRDWLDESIVEIQRKLSKSESL